MLGFGTDDGIAEGSGRHYDAAALVIGQIDGPAMLHGIGDGGVHGLALSSVLKVTVRATF